MLCEGFKVRIYQKDGCDTFNDGTAFSNHIKKIGHDELGIGITMFNHSVELEVLFSDEINKFQIILN